MATLALALVFAPFFLVVMGALRSIFRAMGAVKAG